MLPDLRATSSLPPVSGFRAPVSVTGRGDRGGPSSRPFSPARHGGDHRPAPPRRRSGPRRLRRRHRVCRRRDGPPARPAPARRIVGLQGRGRQREPLGRHAPPPGSDGLHRSTRTPTTPTRYSSRCRTAAAARVTSSSRPGTTVIDLGSDFRLRDPADYPRWYHFEHPGPNCWPRGLRPAGAASGRARCARRQRTPSSARPAASPPTTILALAPLARAG